MHRYARTRTLSRVALAVIVVAVIVVAGTITAVGGASTALKVQPASAAPARYSVQNPIPPRIQWNANYGYCGETSFVSAGLYDGQYLSQYEARAIASRHTPQSRSGSQLLLGVNAGYAASHMHLAYRRWRPGRGATASSFLAWVKGQVIQGHPVIIGIYTNERRFYGDTKPDAGDPSYDHEVVVTGISSRHPLTLPAVYYPTDVITFSDNGLWTGTNRTTPSPTIPYMFSYRFSSFEATRRQANARHGNIYSLADATRDYGIAITGVRDRDRETVPVRVATSVNFERPSIRRHSNKRPKAMALALTVTVSQLRPGVVYHLYRYDSMSKVPNSAFNAHRADAAEAWTFTASTSTFTISQPILSSNEVIYRAVPASAP